MSGNNRGNDGKSQLNSKKTRLYNSRTIKVQNSDPAFDKQDTKLQVPDFIQARKYEIDAFEQSQLKSKSALSTRCFQSLPRVMRRRAASHNVKRMPKRLRNKAIREMNGAVPPAKRKSRGRRLYKWMQTQRILKAASKLRQDRYEVDPAVKSANVRAMFKKLAKGIPDDDDFQGKMCRRIENTTGAVDRTGVGKLHPAPPAASLKFRHRQREFVWLPTHVWHAKRFKMSKVSGFQIPLTPTQKCFKLMSRQNRYRAVCFDTSYYGTLTIECGSLSSATFLMSVLSELTGKSKFPKLVLEGRKSFVGMLRWTPSVSSSDKGKGEGEQQFAPGVVYMNIQENYALIRVPVSVYVDLFRHLQSVVERANNGDGDSNDKRVQLSDCRNSIGSITLSGPSSLRCLSRVFHFKDTLTQELKSTWASLASLRDNSIIPVGTTLSFKIYDPRLWNRPSKFPIRNNNDVFDTIISMNSNPPVDKESATSLVKCDLRKKSLVDQLSVKDLGKIKSHNTAFEKVSHSEIPIILVKTDCQVWTVMLPWYWVQPLWLQLVKIPDLKPGGMKQHHQFQFEQMKPTFPHDFPWSRAGWIYNNVAGDVAQTKDSSKPKSQVSLQTSEDQFSQVFCAYRADWFTLRNMLLVLKRRQTLLSSEGKIDNCEDDPERRLESINDVLTMVKFLHKEKALEPDRIPIRAFDESNVEDDKYYNDTYTIDNMPKIVYTEIPIIPVTLTIAKDGVIQENARIYSAPDCLDQFVVGFVTTGGMNLVVGKCTGIGAIVASKLLEGEKLLYVRNPGKSSMYACSYQRIEN
ncbi:uncharacterized protein LODBEIA_P08490 [Lodderomyces beijingensis]|uniref:Uncharacterized protein n=1 Tax=Lodderomyces beijingensis TaxID=1775926 RepID=A0ABP0ZEN4_9ASCO